MLYYLHFAKEMKENVGGRNTVLRVLRLDSHESDKILWNQQRAEYVLTNYDDMVSLKSGPTTITPKPSC